MAQSIDLGGNKYIDSSAVMMRSSSNTYRKTLESWADGLTDIKSIQIPENSTIALDLASNTRALFIGLGVSAGITGMYSIFATGAGKTNIMPFVAASSLSFEGSEDNHLFVTNSNTNPCRALILVSTGVVNLIV